MPHHLSIFSSQFSSPPAARHYHPTLSIWLSVDPMSDKYPGVSPYVYCGNNPVRLVDANGREISTHTDKDGNVLAVYDDGYLGIFKHTDKEVTEFYNGTTFENNLDELVGFTLCTKSFTNGDKIDYGSYEARDWINAFETSFANASVNYLSNVTFYILNAGNGGIYDPKSYLSNGSQISDNIYLSPRDLGNFAAGRFGRFMNFSKARTLASFGAFELAHNNKTQFLLHYNSYYKKAQNTIGDNLFFPQQVTYGEKSISNYFQRLGYENIKTIRDFNSNFDKIWED